MFRWYFMVPNIFGGILQKLSSFDATQPIFPFVLGVSTSFPPVGSTDPPSSMRLGGELLAAAASVCAALPPCPPLVACGLASSQPCAPSRRRFRGELLVGAAALVCTTLC